MTAPPTRVPPITTDSSTSRIQNDALSHHDNDSANNSTDSLQQEYHNYPNVKMRPNQTAVDSPHSAADSNGRNSSNSKHSEFSQQNSHEFGNSHSSDFCADAGDQPEHYLATASPLRHPFDNDGIHQGRDAKEECRETGDSPSTTTDLPNNSVHPYQNVLSDCLALVFDFHLFHLKYRDYLSWTRAEWKFLTKYATCWSFSFGDCKLGHWNGSVVKQILSRARCVSKMKFRYLDLSDLQGITNDMFPLFRGVQELNLRDTTREYEPSWTPEVLENLRGIRRLILDGCDFPVTESQFANLRGIESLSMWECTSVRLSDEAFKNLRGIKQLDLGVCTPLCEEMTDEALKHFRGIRNLSICGFSQLTSDSLRHLRGIHRLHLTKTSIMMTPHTMRNLVGIQALEVIQHKEVCDDCFPPLRGISELNISGCTSVDGSGFHNLRGIQKLQARGCFQLKEEAFVNLCGVQFLDISINPNQIREEHITPSPLTDAAYANLIGIQHLNISHRSHDRITNQMLFYIQGVHELLMDGCSQSTLSAEALEYVDSAAVLKLAGTNLMTSRPRRKKRDNQDGDEN